MKLFRRKAKKQQMTYKAANLQGIGARSRQEDSFLFANATDASKIQKEGLLFVVADGMGGMKEGKVASETAVASIRADFLMMDTEGDIATQLEASTFKAARLVQERLGGYGGSTLIAGVIFKEQLYYVSVGDSFLYLKRDNQLLRINKEHNLRNQIYLELIEDDCIDRAEMCDPQEAALTQFLGMVGMNEVDRFRKPFSLKSGDIILACSDGVGGVVSQPLLLECLRAENIMDKCRLIEKEIINQRRTNQDNYTAVIVECI